MQTHISTTSFGRRPTTLGQISSQMAAKAVKPETVAHKWKVFQDIREARELLGATDRSLAILNALLSFHPETALIGDAELIVWPSNEQLAARANGMPATTLRRHIAILVSCGLVIRRDSPNGKRFARKGRGGEIEQAYGFDLMPLVARAEEFHDLAETVRAEKKAFRVAKERLTLLRRDVVKLVETGIQEGVPGNWGRVQQTYQMIVGRLPRSASRQLVEDICTDLHGLYTEIRGVLESFVKTKNPDANESQIERHIQNSNPNLLSESEVVFQQGQKPAPSSKSVHLKEARAQGTGTQSQITREMIPLRMVIDACPNIVWVGKGGQIRSWADLMAATELVRPMLGISPSAWGEAIAVLGHDHAAATLAAIYQRADLIHSAGGYLRNLVTRAKSGQFTVWPMLMALLRAKLDGEKSKVSIPSF